MDYQDEQSNQQSELKTDSDLEKQPAEGEKQVKTLVPDRTCPQDISPGYMALSMTDALLYIDSIKNKLNHHGFSTQEISNVCSALVTLANYRMFAVYNQSDTNLASVVTIGIPVSETTNYPMTTGGNSQGIYTSTTGLSNTEAACNSVATSTPLGIGSSMGSGPSFISPNTSRSRDNFLVQAEAAFLEPYRRASPTLASPSAFNNNSFGLGTDLVPSPVNLAKIPLLSKKQKDKVRLEIPEHLVGAIIGCDWKTLTQIKTYSGAYIRISPRGKFAPGTNNRIVTITGLPHEIRSAKYIIERLIAEKELAGEDKRRA